MNQHYKNLLDNVSDIAQLYGHSNNPNENDSGFNIFKVLKLSRYEVKTHTPFLAELLNPSGSHQQGGLFLQIFIKQLKIRSKEKDDSWSQFLESFSCEGASVKKEFPVKAKFKNEHTWGNIDILIKNKQDDKSIIIENKVDAYDQEKQLERYYNYGKAKYQENNFCLIYLTLDGRKPSNYSAGELTESNCLTISYSEDIIQWLKNCNEKLNDKTLSVIINQYINLIHSLTKKIMSDKMKDEVAGQLIKDKDSFEAAYYINESLTLAKNKLINNFFKEIAEETKVKLNNSVTGESHSSKVWFYKEEWKSQFCFCFAEKNFEHFWIGIAKNFKNDYYTAEEVNLRKEIHKRMDDTQGFKTYVKEDSIYAWTGYVEGSFPKDWDYINVWSDILSKEDNEFKDNIRELITKVSRVLDEVYKGNTNNYSQ